MGIFGKLTAKRIGFWAGDQNNFQFVDPLVEFLDTKYKVKKYLYDGDVDLLHKQMEETDICWFEWGNGPIVPATQTGPKKPIINRIHRYELYSESPLHIEWASVDHLIFSSPSMVKKFEKSFPKQSQDVAYRHIGIGVDTELFAFKDKKKIGKQLLYIGRIHPHKNPSLLLQIFAKLHSVDSDYTLKVIGGFSDELFEEYFYDQIDKLRIGDSVNFLGKMSHEEMVRHMQAADHFIITSIIEGLSQASLEAMSCGVRPVIFNYYGSEMGYPKECIYNTVDQAVNLIRHPKITRAEARSLVADKYDVRQCNEQIVSLLEEVK